MTAPEITEAFQTIRDVCPAYAHDLVTVLERRLIVAEAMVALHERFRDMEAHLSAPVWTRGSVLPAPPPRAGLTEHPSGAGAENVIPIGQHSVRA